MKLIERKERKEIQEKEKGKNSNQFNVPELTRLPPTNRVKQKCSQMTFGSIMVLSCPRLPGRGPG